MRTMKELAQEALEIQSACNLSGVVHSFSRAITALREIARAEGWEGTDRLNRHPMCVLFSSKIASLTCSESLTEFHKAYEWAKYWTEEDRATGESDGLDASIRGLVSPQIHNPKGD